MTRNKGFTLVILPTVAIATAISALACANDSPTDGSPQNSSRHLLAAVDTIADRAMRAEQLPSVSIALANSSRLLISTTYGSADLENDVSAGDQTIYRIGSITKQFSAAAILRLAEQQRLSLDDSVGRYVPNLPAAVGGVTIRRLLNHTSGIRSFTAIPAFAAKERLDLSDQELLSIFVDEPFDFAPGSNFLYNNSGYYLLAIVIERLTGRSYADHIRKDLLAPLGLTHTFPCDDQQLIRHRARGYTKSAGVLVNAPYISIGPPKGGGNLCSTASDLARWTQALMGGRVMRAQSYRQMIEPGKLTDGREIAYGLGLFVSVVGGRSSIFHGGGIVGFTSYVGIYSDEDLIIVGLTNSDSAHLFDGHLVRDIFHAVSGAPPLERTDAPPDPSIFDHVAGKYRIGSATFSVTRDGNHLVVHSQNTVDQLWEREFAYEGNGAFVSVRSPDVRITFAPYDRPSTAASITLAGRAFGDAERTSQ